MRLAAALLLAGAGAGGSAVSDTDVAAFKAWLAVHNVSLLPLDWPVQTSLGRGAVAAIPIGANEAVCEMPSSLILTTLKFDSTRFWTLLENLPENDKGRVDDRVKLALLLLRESALGRRSRWAPYINILPRGNVPDFTSEDFVEFQDDNLVTVIKDRYQALESEYDLVRASLDASGRSKDFPQEFFSKEKYIWARQMVDSRCYSVFIDEKRSDALALIPVLDLLNHNSSGKWHTAATKFNRPVPDPWIYSGVLRTFAHEAVGPGAEVFNSYGPQDNVHLIYMYGFAELNNEHDAAHLEGQILPLAWNATDIEAWCLDWKQSIAPCLDFVQTALDSMPTTLDQDLAAMQTKITVPLVYRTQRKAILHKFASTLRTLLS